MNRNCELLYALQMRRCRINVISLLLYFWLAGHGTSLRDSTSIRDCRLDSKTSPMAVKESLAFVDDDANKNERTEIDMERCYAMQRPSRRRKNPS